MHEWKKQYCILKYGTGSWKSLRLKNPMSLTLSIAWNTPHHRRSLPSVSPKATRHNAQSTGRSGLDSGINSVF